MALQAQESISQPIEIEISENKGRVGKEQRSEDSGPFPAEDAFFFALQQKGGGQNIKGEREGEGPKEEEFVFGAEPNLKAADFNAGDGGNADDHEDQERAIDALDQKPLHKAFEFP